MAALLAAQQISRAAQFQVERGDLEASAQIGKFFQRRQPAPRDGRQFDFRWQQQVCVGAPIRAAYAAAQLIELRKPMRSARLIRMVLQSGMSSPFSMMVVATRMSAS